MEININLISNVHSKSLYELGYDYECYFYWNDNKVVPNINKDHELIPVTDESKILAPSYEQVLCWFEEKGYRFKIFDLSINMYAFIIFNNKSHAEFNTLDKCKYNLLDQLIELEIKNRSTLTSE